MRIEHLIVGSGLMARHWSQYMTLLGIPHHTWCRKTNSLAELNAILGESLNTPPNSKIEKVFLAISDSAIEAFYQTQLKNFKGTVFHFSGATEVPNVTSIHPLMSFGPALYDLEHYKAIPLITTHELRLAEFPNPKFLIPASDKSRYHALCVIAGNFSVMIWQKFFYEMEKYGIPLEACHPYFRQINSNLESFPFSALTGPLMRNDIRTMELNMHALHGDPFRDVYKHMVQAFELQLKALQKAKKESV